MISTRNLSIAYQGKTILRDATVEAPRGKVLALVGPSGCGKSSFLAAINRMTDLIPHATVAGQIQFCGRNTEEEFPSAVQLRRQIGMIFQKPNPFAMSIRRNVELALWEQGERNVKELARISKQVLQDVGLWDEVCDRLHQSALELSGGQQQRLCIARALALQPDVLLMDEPCSALDPVAAERVENLILSMRGNYTVIIVTHNLAQARRLADNLAVFWTRDGVGEIIEQGATEQLFTAAKSEIVRSYLSGKRG